MNPYKAAISIVRRLLADQIENEDDGHVRGMYQVVDNELSELHDWISAEENGLSDTQILYASEAMFEGGASGLPECDACKRSFDVYMLVTRRDTGEVKEVRACKQHMLDPGPLLDW
jgi:hypothetical protein